MPDFEAFRSKLRDRQKKAGAGRVTARFHLDTDLIEQLAELEKQKQDLEGSAASPDDKRMAKPPKIDTTQIDAKIDAKRAEIKASTVKMIFASLSSVEYEELRNSFIDDDGMISTRAFLMALAERCLFEVYEGDEKIEFAKDQSADVISEIRKSITVGEWEPTVVKVRELNERQISLPF